MKHATRHKNHNFSFIPLLLSSCNFNYILKWKNKHWNSALLKEVCNRGVAYSLFKLDGSRQATPYITKFLSLTAILGTLNLCISLKFYLQDFQINLNQRLDKKHNLIIFGLLHGSRVVCGQKSYLYICM